MPKYLLRSLILLAVIFAVFGFSLHTLAHSGGTDSQGGHNSPDGYHYHHGNPPHQHPNGECPYDYDDNVDHSSRSSSGGETSSRSSDDSLSGWIILLIVIGLFFVSFYLPVIIELLIGKEIKGLGCISWLLFIGLSVAIAYLVT